MTVSEVKEILKANGFDITKEKRGGNNLYTVLELSNGCLVNCWDSGKINCQGKNTESVSILFKKQEKNNGK